MSEAIDADLEAELGVQAPSTDQLADLKVHIDKHNELSSMIEQMEETVKSWKADLHLLVTVTIPECMASAGVSDFTTADGYKVAIKDFLNGSLPKEGSPNREFALEFVQKAGGTNIIKETFEVALAKGAVEQAAKVQAILTEAKIPFSRELSIHAQTYCAFFRELMQDPERLIEIGEELPFDRLGLYAGRAAKVTAPKPEKPKAPKKSKR